MMRRPILTMLMVAAVMILAGGGRAQTSRPSVKAAEVNGTFRLYFSGKYKGNYNEVRIKALGKGKLRVAMDLTYPYTDGTGALGANVGEDSGIADIDGDTAVFTSSESLDCKIEIKFLRPGVISLHHLSPVTATCGYGLNVSAEGAYKKFSSKIPSF